MENLEQLRPMLSDATIPYFHKVHFKINDEKIGDLEQAIRQSLQRPGTLDRIKPGSTVALTAGSREVSNITLILKTIISELEKIGAQPFIVPTMGSHGGATAQGQIEVLENFGITEETMGVPIKSSMDTVKVGVTEDGLDVRVDKNALEADYMIPIGRVKPHTDFKGEIESGVLKMIAIGLGKQYGASICHMLGMPDMPKNVRSIAEVVMEKCSLPFGVAVVENGFHETWKVAAIPAENVYEEEQALLLEAKKLVPVIPYDKVDILVVEEMGKNISGTGMDTNVIGKSAILGTFRPFIERIGCFSLTHHSHGNANGMGMLDSVPLNYYRQVDFVSTYPNAITSTGSEYVRLPAVMDSDEYCVKFLIKTCTGCCAGGKRIVWIKNTLSMSEFHVSEALYPDSTSLEGVTAEPDKLKADFDDAGSFRGFVKA